MSNYPNEYDVFNDPTSGDKTSTSTSTHSELHEQTNSAIEAIQTTLGIKPQGLVSTIAERIIKLQAMINELQSDLNAKSLAMELLSSGNAGELLTSNGPGNDPSYSADIPKTVSAIEDDLSDLESIVDTITDQEGRIRLNTIDDASLSSTTHAFQIGPESGPNMVMDPNEIITRNNGVANTLFINAEGGNVLVNSTIATYPFSISNGRLQGTSISNFFTLEENWSQTSTSANNFCYRIGGFLMFSLTLTRGSDDSHQIDVPSNGNIVNHNIAIFVPAARGNVNINIPVHSGGLGRVAIGWYNPSTGRLGLAAVGGGSAVIGAGNTLQLAGTVWLGNSD